MAKAEVGAGRNLAAEFVAEARGEQNTRRTVELAPSWRGMRYIEEGVFRQNIKSL